MKEEAGAWPVGEEVAAQTLEVWRYVVDAVSVLRLGIMYPTLTGRPCVWAEVLDARPRAFFHLRKGMREMHKLLGEDLIYAEVREGDQVGFRFATVAGFRVFHRGRGVILMLSEV